MPILPAYVIHSLIGIAYNYLIKPALIKALADPEKDWDDKDMANAEQVFQKKTKGVTDGTSEKTHDNI